MVGVNQVIMLSLNMVIIASMIGAGGLGFDVLKALRRLDFGAGLEAGFCHRGPGRALDRLSQALAPRGPVVRTGGLLARYLWGSLALILSLAAGSAGAGLPAVQTYPETAQLRPAPSGRRRCSGSTSPSSTRSRRSRTSSLSGCWFRSSGSCWSCPGSWWRGFWGWRAGGWEAAACGAFRRADAS
jgi:glycine betaine/proline transport system permease protein